MNAPTLIFALLVITGGSGQTRGAAQPFQQNAFFDRRQAHPQSHQIPVLPFIKLVERGIATNTVDTFASLFGPSVFVNVTPRENGYVSANQAVSMLTNFFGARRLVSFSFTSINDKSPTPWATGRCAFAARGGLESVQIYISFVPHDSSWSINQFNIY